ncbi:MAG TPA: hypothetical protein VKQ70_00520 [Caulobacteraceae bacterium]|jgi:hypothetical protein|nr:hypothetical protein [Caulobacteraceae bacterium]
MTISKKYGGGPLGGRPAGALALGERVIAGAFERDDRSEWRVTLDCDRRGQVVIDIRRFEEFAGPAKARTGTRFGISIPVERLPELINALTKAQLLLVEERFEEGRRR